MIITFIKQEQPAEHNKSLKLGARFLSSPLDRNAGTPDSTRIQQRGVDLKMLSVIYPRAKYISLGNNLLQVACHVHRKGPELVVFIMGRLTWPFLRFSAFCEVFFAIQIHAQLNNNTSFESLANLPHFRFTHLVVLPTIHNAQNSLHCQPSLAQQTTP